jgi:hypothetical protein
MACEHIGIIGYVTKLCDKKVLRQKQKLVLQNGCHPKSDTISVSCLSLPRFNPTHAVETESA